MTRPRRLISIAHSYVVGLNRRLAHEMSRAGGGRWEVTVVAPDYFHGSRDLRPVRFQPLEAEPVQVEVVPARATAFVHAFTYGPQLGEALRGGHWDLVHCWEEPYVLAGAQVAWNTPAHVPLAFWTAQNLDKTYPPPFRQFERYTVRRSAGWMACGQSTLQTLAGKPLYRDKPHRILPLGVDVERFRPDAQARIDTRRELGWDDHAGGAPVIGFVGRLTHEKGLKLAMQTLEGLGGAWRALFIGAGPMEQELRAWATRFGDRVRIRVDVSHDQVPRYLNAIDVLIAPSQTTRRWREQFGRMLVEGFATGLCVVGSDSGEIPHVIGDAGIVLSESEVTAWRRALAELLQSPERRRELGERGLQRAHELFSWSSIAPRYLEFFEQLLDARQAPRAPRAVPSSETGSLSLKWQARAARASQVANVRSAPRKLLSIAHSYVVGMNRRLVHEMARAGGQQWEIAAVAPDYFCGTQDLRPVHFESQADEPVRVEIVPAHLSQLVHLFYYSRKLKSILEEGWDLVHAWEEPYIVAGAQIARWAPRHAALVYRTAQSLDKWYPPPFNWLERFNMSRADGWICSGSLVAKTLQHRPMYRERPMRLIPLGVDLQAFRPDPAAGRAVRQRLGWDDPGPPVIGYLGRFTHAKGVTLLTSALDSLRSPWRAIFVGAGPMEAQLRSWASRHGDRARLCTDVHHADVPAYLNAMDLLAAPSQTTRTWREQFGRMLIEAFACGVPVVGSDSGEIPFVVGDAGVVCPERDTAAWARELERLINDSAARRELAERGLARAPCYAWSNIARQYLEFFTEVLDTPRSRRQGRAPQNSTAPAAAA